MALSVLFWNVRKNDGCRPSLVRLAHSEQIEVLLLAEPLAGRSIRSCCGLNSWRSCASFASSITTGARPCSTKASRGKRTGATTCPFSSASTFERDLMPEMTDSLLAAAVPPVPLTEQTPREILEAEAAALTRRTGGLLIGDLRARGNDDATMIWFDAMVPALGGGRQAILVAIHPNDEDYPAWIRAACFPRSLYVPPYTLLTPAEDKEFVASGPEQFRRLVEKVMQSADVVADVEWLSARAREALNRPKDDAERNGP